MAPVLSGIRRADTRQEAPLVQTMRFIGLAALVLSVAACGGGKQKHAPKTQKEVWQSEGFQSGLKASASH
ncbi:hypothetical protein HLH48_17310 [Gluconacetobacter sacchari]|uniref:Uncharacterized protein n=1 Tax=Gluconacetobacter sacchari TaxID=92759 RepID=A0A7W4IFQ5_9PROT|nr:hypothetical protein [Gluconacetobacter sacchari]